MMIARVFPSCALAALFVACGSRSALLVSSEEAPKRPTASAGDAVPGTATTPGMPTSTFIYTLDESNFLWRFDPLAATDTLIGPVNCESGGVSSAIAMAVDRSGTIYIAYSDGRNGHVDQVSSTTASCERSFTADSVSSFIPNGMAFAAEPGTNRETLYAFIADSNHIVDLVSLDARSFAANGIAEIFGSATGVRIGATANGGILGLTGTGSGSLFMFATEPLTGKEYAMVQVDRVTGACTLSTWTLAAADSQVAGFPPVTAAFWGSALYVFGVDGDATTTAVLRVGPNGKPSTMVAQRSGRCLLLAVQTTAPTP